MPKRPRPKVTLWRCANGRVVTIDDAMHRVGYDDDGVVINFTSRDYSDNMIIHEPLGLFGIDDDDFINTRSLATGKLLSFGSVRTVTKSIAFGVLKVDLKLNVFENHIVGFDNSKLKKKCCWDHRPISLRGLNVWAACNCIIVRSDYRANRSSEFVKIDCEWNGDDFVFKEPVVLTADNDCDNFNVVVVSADGSVHLGDTTRPEIVFVKLSPK